MLYICNMKYYIYTLSHPITNEVKYIGKTNNISKRYSAHLNDKSKSYKNSWIKSLLNEDLLPVIEILEEFDNELLCYNAEIYWIEQFKSWGFNLTNLQTGGIGGNSESLKLDKNPNAKISIETVLSIKNYLLNTDKTIKELALIHNCKESTIQNIKYGSWSEITGFTGKEKWVRKASVEKRRNALKDCGLYERQSIKVLQYDLDNNFIQKFNSISEASEKTNTNRTSLSQCLNNKLKSANKFIWKRENN